MNSFVISKMVTTNVSQEEIEEGTTKKFVYKDKFLAELKDNDYDLYKKVSALLDEHLNADEEDTSTPAKPVSTPSKKMIAE